MSLSADLLQKLSTQTVAADLQPGTPEFPACLNSFLQQQGLCHLQDRFGVLLRKADKAVEHLLNKLATYVVNPKPHTLNTLIRDPNASHSNFFLAEFYSLLLNALILCEVEVEDFFVRLRLHHMHHYATERGHQQMVEAFREYSALAYARTLAQHEKCKEVLIEFYSQHIFKTTNVSP